MKDPKYTGQCVEVMQETKEELHKCCVEAGIGTTIFNACVLDKSNIFFR